MNPALTLSSFSFQFEFRVGSDRAFCEARGEQSEFATPTAIRANVSRAQIRMRRGACACLRAIGRLENTKSRRGNGCALMGPLAESGFQPPREPVEKPETPQAPGRQAGKTALKIPPPSSEQRLRASLPLAAAREARWVKASEAPRLFDLLEWLDGFRTCLNHRLRREDEQSQKRNYSSSTVWQLYWLEFPASVTVLPQPFCLGLLYESRCRFRRADIWRPHRT